MIQTKKTKTTLNDNVLRCNSPDSRIDALPTDTVIEVRRPAPIEHHLEAMRGFAALVVVWSHAIVNHKLLDPGYGVQGIALFLPPSHLAVLLFFVLSGYVIGLSTKQKLDTRQLIGRYLKKRLLRIYPIYFVTLCLALAVSTHLYSIKTIVGNFSITQIILTDIVKEHDASWSLHYEVLFYLLFIPISFLRLPALKLAAGCVALGIANRLLFPTHPLLTSYVFGFAFWLAGLWLADRTRSMPRRDVSASRLLGLLLIILSFNYYSVFSTLVFKIIILTKTTWLYYGPVLDEAQPYGTQISIEDFAFLPIAAAVVLIFSRVDFPFRRWVIAIIGVAPALTFVFLASHAAQIDWPPYVIATVSYLLGAALLFIRVELLSANAMRLLAIVGSFSYGLYIVHAPLLYLFHRILPSFSGTPITYTIRLIVFIATSLGTAWWLEKKLQPWIKARID